MTFANVEAERSILSAILVDPSHLHDAEQHLKPLHFFFEGNRLIFEAMQRLSEQGSLVDPVMLRNELSNVGKLESCGGLAYIASLVDGQPRVKSILPWVQVVRERAKRRTARLLGERLVSLTDGADNTDALLDRRYTALSKLLEADQGQSVQSMHEALREAQADLDEFCNGSGLTGVPCGFPDLDELVGGWQPGTLIIVAARPGEGKSVLCAQWSIHAGEHAKRGLVFSMEMPPRAMVLRMLLSAAEVDRWEVKTKERARAQVVKAYGRLAELPLVFDKRESPTTAQIRATAKMQHALKGLDFVVVDYLQRIEVDSKVDNWLAVGDSAKGLKSLARMLNVPVIVACQLNRNAEGKAPTLADLAESGKIEREADVVLLLHPDPETKDMEYPTTHLIVAKHRAGPCGRFQLSFEKRYTRFLPMARVPS